MCNNNVIIWVPLTFTMIIIYLFVKSTYIEKYKEEMKMKIIRKWFVLL